MSMQHVVSFSQFSTSTLNRYIYTIYKPASSMWPFDNPNGGHVFTPEKVTNKIPNFGSQPEEPGNRCWFQTLLLFHSLTGGGVCDPYFEYVLFFSDGVKNSRDLSVRQGSLKLTILRGSNSAQGMVNLRDPLLIVHCLGWYHISWEPKGTPPMPPPPVNKALLRDY